MTIWPKSWQIIWFQVSSDPTLLDKFALVGDTLSKEAALINVGFDLVGIRQEIEKSQWKVTCICLSSGNLEQVGRSAELSHLLNVPVLAARAHLPQLQAIKKRADHLGLCGIKLPTVQTFLTDNHSICLGLYQMTWLDMSAYIWKNQSDS